MRKNVRKVIAFTLVLLQLALVVCVIPVGALAGENGKKLSYNIFRTRQELTLDGVMDENEGWKNVPWSESFVSYSIGDSSFVMPAIPGRFKMLWYSDAEGDATPTKAYLYYFLEIEDPDGEYTGDSSAVKWNYDQFEFSVDENNSNSPVTAQNVQLEAKDYVRHPHTSFYNFIRREGTHVYVEGYYIFSTLSNAVSGKKIGIDF